MCKVLKVPIRLSVSRRWEHGFKTPLLQAWLYYMQQVFVIELRLKI